LRGLRQPGAAPNEIAEGFAGAWFLPSGVIEGRSEKVGVHGHDRQVSGVVVPDRIGLEAGWEGERRDPGALGKRDFGPIRGISAFVVVRKLISFTLSFIKRCATSLVGAGPNR
jgi:hypothetical protein